MADAPIAFVKGHGLGNDYLVLDAATLPSPLTPAAVTALCDRHRGVGGDGILVRVPSAVADAGVRIWNPDGSEAEKSGNGLRIFAHWLRTHGGLARDVFTVETPGGIVACRCDRDAHGAITVVTVEMGRASFRPAEIPMQCAAADAVEVPLPLDDGTTLVVTALTVGNLHCVVFVERPDDDACRRLGPRIEHHPAFPNRTNVQLARATSRTAVEIRIWERGAGSTLASGSSSCAAAAAAVRTGRCDPGAIVVTMPGGVLEVDVRADWWLRLRGPVAETYTGVLSPELVRLLW